MVPGSNLMQINLWVQFSLCFLIAFAIAYCLLKFIKLYPSHLFQTWKEDSEYYLENLPKPLPEGNHLLKNIVFCCSYIFVVLGLWYFLGLGFHFFGGVLFISLLLPIAIIDWRYLFILDNLVYPFLWAGLFFNLFGFFTTINSALFGALFGYLVIFIPEKLYEWIRKKPGIGLGDAKMCSAITAWIGVEYLMFLCLASFVLAVLGFIVQILFRSNKDNELKPIPFGPSLAIIGFLILIYNLYLRIPLIHG
jgi:prepilin signal peptidase PulO-like enzyme (type II secretory pathway)